MDSNFDGIQAQNITFGKPDSLSEAFKSQVKNLNSQDVISVNGVHEVHEEYFGTSF